MSTKTVSDSEAFLTKRRLGWAGLAAVIGSAALCCGLPLLVAVGIGGGAIAAAARLFRPGSELVVGALAFSAVLVGAAVRMYVRKRRIKAAIADGAPGSSLMAGGCGCSPSIGSDQPAAEARDESRRFGDNRRAGA